MGRLQAVGIRMEGFVFASMLNLAGNLGFSIRTSEEGPTLRFIEKHL